MWGATYPSYLTPLKSLQNRAIKLLSGATRFQSAHLLYKDYNILNLNSLLSQETAKFMYKFIHKQLPVQFDNYFNSVLAINESFTKEEVRELHKKKINFIFLDSAQTDYKDPSNIEELKYGTIYLTKLRITTVIYQLSKNSTKSTLSHK